jgi:hypothetical protein
LSKWEQAQSRSITRLVTELLAEPDRPGQNQDVGRHPGRVVAERCLGQIAGALRAGCSTGGDCGGNQAAGDEAVCADGITE